MKTLITILCLCLYTIGKGQDISLKESIQYLEADAMALTSTLTIKGWVLETVNKDNTGNDILIFSYGKTSNGEAVAFITKGSFCLEYQVPNDKVFQQQRLETQKYSFVFAKEVMEDYNNLYTIYTNALWSVKFITELSALYYNPSYNIVVCKLNY